MRAPPRRHGGRPVGRPPNEVRRYYANFTYQAASWTKPRRVVAKVEWHPGELVPRIGFVVTNLSRLAERVVAFYNQRGTAEQWIKEGKNAINWTRLSCRSFAANAVRLQLHALAYNLGMFLQAADLPDEVDHAVEAIAPDATRVAYAFAAEDSDGDRLSATDGRVVRVVGHRLRGVDQDVREHLGDARWKVVQVVESKRPRSARW